MAIFTLYTDTPHCAEELEEELVAALKDHGFPTTLSDAKGEFNEDEIAKYKIHIKVEADH